MRVLTLSLNAWNDTLATGNTFSNFFSSREKEDVFANVFCRNEKIDNSFCTRYFRVTEKDIVRGLVGFSSAGRAFDSSLAKPNSSGENMSLLSSGNPKGNLLRRWRPTSLLFLREIIWCLGTWKGDTLKNFLSDYNPDVIYMHVHNNWYMHKLLWYCKKITGAKVVVFSGDDVWSYNRKGLLYRLYHSILRKYISYTFTHADLVFGGSPQLCDEFETVFNRPFSPLYKTCDSLSISTMRRHQLPLRAVYCGNLLYGREEVLIQIAGQLRQINKEGEKVKLYIYSNTPLSKRALGVLNDGKNSFYEGPKPYNEIKEILNSCDFSVFAESFKLKDIKKTRLSFSTKIIDYLQADSAILAVGPSMLASIDYLTRSKVAFVVDDLVDFSKVVKQIISHPGKIDDIIVRKYEYAKQYHTEPTLLKEMRSLL